MPTFNRYAKADWTELGSDAKIGSIQSPVQTTYVNPVTNNSGVVATATAEQIFGSTSPGQADAATWSAGMVYCSADFRLGIRGDSDANSAVFTLTAGVHDMASFQIPTYSATFSSYISGALVSATQIWIYQTSGSNANWRLVLVD